jgi:hypothetical protein
MTNFKVINAEGDKAHESRIDVVVNVHLKVRLKVRCFIENVEYELIPSSQPVEHDCIAFSLIKKEESKITF